MTQKEKDLEDENKKLNEEKSELINKIDEFTQKQNELKNDKDSLEEKIKEKDSQINNLNDKIANLEKTNKEMEENLLNNNNKDEKIKNLEKENTSLDSKIKELQKEINDLKSKNNKNMMMKSTIQMDNLRNDPKKKSNMVESRIMNDNDAPQTEFKSNESISPFDSNLKGSIMPQIFSGIPETNEEYASNSNSIQASTNNNLQEEVFGLDYMDDDNEERKDEIEEHKEEITLKDDRKKSLKKPSLLKQSNLFEINNQFN